MNVRTFDISMRKNKATKEIEKLNLFINFNVGGKTGTKIMSESFRCPLY